MLNKFKKLFNFFNPVDDFNRILNTNYTYKDLDNTINIVSPHKDIVEFNKAVEDILKLDILETHLDKNNLPPTSNNYLTLKHWCTNDGRMLNDINSEISRWCLNSKLLVTKYEQLTKLKKNSTVISFNTRKLKPYIINVEAIKNTLINKE